MCTWTSLLFNHWTRYNWSVAFRSFFWHVLRIDINKWRHSWIHGSFPEWVNPLIWCDMALAFSMLEWYYQLATVIFLWIDITVWYIMIRPAFLWYIDYYLYSREREREREVHRFFPSLHIHSLSWLFDRMVARLSLSFRCFGPWYLGWLLGSLFDFEENVVVLGYQLLLS